MKGLFRIRSLRGVPGLALAFLASTSSPFLAGCDGESPTGSSAAPDTALRIEALGLSIHAAPGWTGRRGDAAPVYLTVARDGFDGFQPSLNVVADAYPEAPDLESIVKALADAKQAEPGADVIPISQGMDRLGGTEAGRLDYRFTAQGQDLRARQYALRHRGLLILVTCVDGLDGFAAREAEFNAMLASLELR